MSVRIHSRIAPLAPALVRGRPELRKLQNHGTPVRDRTLWVVTQP